MHIRHSTHPAQLPGFDTDGLRQHYLVDDLFVPGEIRTVYTDMGDQSTANVREIRKFVHADGIRSSQLVLGVTSLAPGSVWNTMPPHTHDRRTECYLYVDLPEDHRVIHLCGEPQNTRNIVVRNEEAVLSPSWSVHSGAGTHAYTFVWAMGGENQAYDDMDQVAVTERR